MNEKKLIIGFGLFLIFFAVCFSVAVAYGQDKMIKLINERCYIEPNTDFYADKNIPAWQVDMANLTFEGGVS